MIQKIKHLLLAMLLSAFLLGSGLVANHLLAGATPAPHLSSHSILANSGSGAGGDPGNE